MTETMMLSIALPIASFMAFKSYFNYRDHVKEITDNSPSFKQTINMLAMKIGLIELVVMCIDIISNCLDKQ